MLVYGEVTADVAIADDSTSVHTLDPSFLTDGRAALLARFPPTMPVDEIDWIEELDAGAERAEAAIAALRERVLKSLRYALRSHGAVNEAQLQDFTQEALLRILECRPQFRGNSRFTTWAYAIAINVAFAELRRKHWQNVSLHTLVEEGARLRDRDVLMTDELEASDERARVMDIVRRAIDECLTEKQRAAILGGLRGLPIDQITALLGINRNAMYKLFHDARRALKARLEAEGISPETIRRAFPQ